MSSDLFNADQETLDQLTGYGLRIIQPRHGYRFSLDPLLLADFAAAGDGERIADLGTGCGIMPLLFARITKLPPDEGGGEHAGDAAPGKQPNSQGTGSAGACPPLCRITGVEFQPVMSDLARRNVGLNGLDGRVEIVAEDILSLKKIFPVDSFDLVVSNPPYRRPGTGKVSPRRGRDEARHETTATLADFLAAAKYLVKPSGRICFIYHPCRLAELMAEANAQKLAPLRLRMVHGNVQAEARMFLVELAKGRSGELVVEPPLMVRDDNGGYSEEKLKIFKGSGYGLEARQGLK